MTLPLQFPIFFSVSFTPERPVTLFKLIFSNCYPRSTPIRFLLKIWSWFYTFPFFLFQQVRRRRRSRLPSGLRKRCAFLFFLPSHDLMYTFEVSEVSRRMYQLPLTHFKDFLIILFDFINFNSLLTNSFVIFHLLLLLSHSNYISIRFIIITSSFASWLTSDWDIDPLILTGVGGSIPSIYRL